MRILLAIVCGFGLAASALAAESPKYGVVDMQTVILSVSEGKAAREELEKEIKTTETELLKQKEELDKMNEEWQAQAALLSEDARMKKQQDFQQKFLALRNAEMEFQATIKRKEQQATQKIAVKVAKVVDTIAKEKKLVAVFETNSAGLLYLENPLDLTQTIVDTYEKDSKKK